MQQFLSQRPVLSQWSVFSTILSFLHLGEEMKERLWNSVTPVCHSTCRTAPVNTLSTGSEVLSALLCFCSVAFFKSFSQQQETWEVALSLVFNSMKLRWITDHKRSSTLEHKDVTCLGVKRDIIKWRMWISHTIQVEQSVSSVDSCSFSAIYE